jgi:hypothetical protein
MVRRQGGWWLGAWVVLVVARGSENSWWNRCWWRRVVLGVSREKSWEWGCDFFWSDPWLGGAPLCMRFLRLFDLADNKLSTVAEMRGLRWDEGREVWKWRLCLWALEEDMLGECRTLLHDISLQSNITDKWQWSLDPNGNYSVKGVYILLTSQEDQRSYATLELTWHRHVPFKVSILAWRLLRNRLPTKENLVTRGIIPHDPRVCVTGCGAIESAHHVFLSCPSFSSLWSHVRLCIGVESADPKHLRDHFVQFVHSSGGTRSCRSFMQLLWLWCVWVI